MTRRTWIIAAVLLLAVAAASSYAYSASWKYQLRSRVTFCNTEAPHLRFSCYRAELEKVYDSNPLYQENMRSFVNFVSDAGVKFRSEDDDISYAHFGTNCHTFYHALGDTIGTYGEGSITQLHALCPLDCTSGCAMGLHKRMALKSGFSDEENKEFYRACTDSEKHQCTHEIGHSLQDKNVSSILGVLDGLSEKYYGLAQPQTYTYTIKAKPDIDSAFGDCRRLLPSDEWEYCFTGVGHNFFLYSAFSEKNYKTQIDECMNVSAENRDPCLAYLLFRIGINEAAPKFLNGEYDAGKAICDDLVQSIGSRKLSNDCYKGIGGGIGLFLESELINYAPESLHTNEMKKRILDYGLMCKKVADKSLRQDCILGLLGTKFKNYYDMLVLYDPEIDELSKWDLTGFQVTS